MAKGAPYNFALSLAPTNDYGRNNGPIGLKFGPEFRIMTISSSLEYGVDLSIVINIGQMIAV